MATAKDATKDTGRRRCGRDTEIVERAGRSARSAAKGAPEDAWLPATVPGCVHTDLLAAGKIGDPFHRLNEKDQQWIENESWEYRTTSPVDAATLARERVELVFAGLDTFAEVFVNGAPVLTADNMFRSWRVDVKAQLKAGRQPDPRALRVADREGQARLRQARLQAARRQRPGQGDGQHVGAQGALPLRLGLGPALRHQRHLAAGRAGGVGRRRASTTRRCSRTSWTPRPRSWASWRASSPPAPASARVTVASRAGRRSATPTSRSSPASTT